MKLHGLVYPAGPGEFPCWGAPAGNCWMLLLMQSWSHGCRGLCSALGARIPNGSYDSEDPGAMSIAKLLTLLRYGEE